MRVLPLLASTLVLGAQTPTGAARPESASPQPAWVDDSGRFAVALPVDWRPLTPDEGRLLQARANPAIPDDILAPEPPRYLVFGPVDQWLAGSFDGRVLTMVELDGEPEVGPNGIAGIEEHWRTMSAQGTPVATESLEVGSVGRDAHPALLGRFRVGSGSAQRARFDAYVPAGGQTYSFALTWPTDDIPAGAAAFERLRASLAMAAKPRGPSNFGSKILWAGLLGLGIGVVLHGIRKRARG